MKTLRGSTRQGIKTSYVIQAMSFQAVTASSLSASLIINNNATDTNPTTTIINTVSTVSAGLSVTTKIITTRTPITTTTTTTTTTKTIALKSFPSSRSSVTATITTAATPLFYTCTSASTSLIAQPPPTKIFKTDHLCVNAYGLPAVAAAPAGAATVGHPCVYCVIPVVLRSVFYFILRQITQMSFATQLISMLTLLINRNLIKLHLVTKQSHDVTNGMLYDRNLTLADFELIFFVFVMLIKETVKNDYNLY
uniref:Uncharacterized protein n=1 Tax=Glossina brevipalpis TaxID=37001 RepID=A0A1A9W7F7_9MUSC